MSFPIPTPTPLAHSLLPHCNTNASFITQEWNGISTPCHRPLHKTFSFGIKEGRKNGGGRTRNQNKGTQPFIGRINTCSCIPRNPAVHTAVTTASVPQTTAQPKHPPGKDLRMPFPFLLALFIFKQCRMPTHHSPCLLRAI